MTESVQAVRVLLVDDSRPFRELMGTLLARGTGFVVVGEASDGAEAIEQVNKHHPDVVLLDVAMPRMDGLQALPEIKAVVPSPKVVMLSSFSAREMEGKALAQGADAYLEKGRMMDEIKEAIVRVHRS